MSATLPLPIERVLIVSYEYPPLGGGGGVIIRDLAQELARRVGVTVLTSGRSGLSPREIEAGVELVRAPVLLRQRKSVASLPSMLSFFPSSLRRGRSLLAERRFDVVHASFAVPSGPSSVLLARRAGLPLVLSVHGGDLYDPSKRLSPHRTPLLRQTVRWVIHASDRVVAQSSDTEARLRELYGASRVERIPLAAVRPRVEPLGREALGFSTEDVVLVCVGRLIPRKGLEELLRVLAELRDARVRLVVVGSGPLRDALEQRARALGVAARVLFTGFVSDERKWQLLEASDLYVSTTLHEGFGIVFLEAMQAGLPVVTYDCGGQRDFVDAEVGALVPVGDRARLLTCVRELVGDVERRRRLGDAARRRARAFGIDRFAERYLALYRECVEARHGAQERADALAG